ncbi:hypothetical protein [Herbaspirillum sp. YR522]|uniref:hypothetical protein n=1 Tax=Herbaspirillum sp. YR522 TaxID=1144342 RepID=UPI00026FB34A|nr:hypothetical protein [Herbaspirillum sp. YR522]EJN07791.1 hypothetical protein PMI40_01687 [Herbaspirillum sp. YR522]
MADFTDVANTLVGLIAGIVYPEGTAAPSITGVPVKVYQGWPDVVQIGADMKGGIVNISVFPTPTERILPARMMEWQELAVVPATVTLAVTGSTVTFGGAAAPAQNIAVLVDNKPYVYAVQASDTLASIATALATLISADRAASSVGPVLTVSGAKSIIARIGTEGTSIRELMRLEKVFQVSIWANCFDQRDPLAALLMPALAAAYRIELPDGTQGTVRYRSSAQIDDLQKQGVYRHDLLYAVEFAVTHALQAVQVVTEQTAVSVVPLPGGAPVGQIIINT